MVRWTARQPCKHCSNYCRRSLSVHGHGQARQSRDDNTFFCFTFNSMRLTPTIKMPNKLTALAESSSFMLVYAQVTTLRIQKGFVR